jgi:hypothetical protein
MVWPKRRPGFTNANRVKKDDGGHPQHGLAPLRRDPANPRFAGFRPETRKRYPMNSNSVVTLCTPYEGMGNESNTLRCQITSRDPLPACG